MRHWPARKFAFLLGLCGVAATASSSGVGFFRGHAPGWVTALLELAALASWTAIVVLLFGQYWSGRADPRPARRLSAKALAFTLAAILAAAIAGALLGGLASSLRGEDPVGSSAYATKLTRTFRGLESKRSNAYRRLASVKQAAAQAKIVAGLSHAFAFAAAALAASDAPRTERRLERLIAARLKETAHAYATLRKAIIDRTGDQAAVDSARRAVARATGRLRRAETKLRERGYRLTLVPAQSG